MSVTFVAVVLSLQCKKLKTDGDMKHYQDMTPVEQAQWIDEFARLSNPIPTDPSEIKQLFQLLSAWPFAEKFCGDALKYGDYMARIYRLPVYIDKVKDALAEGLVQTDANGKPIAVVAPGAPLRRRGRPTREEAAARLRGEVQVVQEDTPETRRRRAVAKLLGLQIVTGEPVREKNNAEIAAEKAAKRAEEAKIHPSLFKDLEDSARGQVPGMSGDGAGDDNSAGGDARGQSPGREPAKVQSPGSERPSTGSERPNAQQPSPEQPIRNPSMAEIYAERIDADRLHLNELAWLCSKDLQERIAKVRDQRTAFGDASQTAKVLAEHGGNQEEIAMWAKRAEEALKAYESTYAAVDEELAIVFARLQMDEPYKEKFCNRFKGVDLVQIAHITRPYYDKLRSPEFDLRIRTMIEQDSPEYAAKMKAEEERKQEITDILRYLKRKDKPNVAQRIKTMETRYARLIELMGEEEAKVYRPIVDAAIADYEANHKKEEKPADKKSKKNDKATDGDAKDVRGQVPGRKQTRAKAAARDLSPDIPATERSSAGTERPSKAKSDKSVKSVGSKKAETKTAKKK